MCLRSCPKEFFFTALQVVDCKNLLWEIAIIKNMRYHVKKLPVNRSYYPYWESGPMDRCLWSPSIIPSAFVTHIPAFANSCCKSWNEFYFPDRSGQVKQFTAIIFNKTYVQMSRKGVSNCFAISLWFRFAIQLDTSLVGDMASVVTAISAAGINWTNWLQCWWSLWCCNQSVHVYQNCLGQS